MEDEKSLPGVNEFAASTHPQMINEKQAARVLSVSVAALRRWRREGRGPEFAHLETCVRYPLRSIEKFCTENSSANKRVGDSRPAPAPRSNI
jgi:hypothetical protein